MPSPLIDGTWQEVDRSAEAAPKKNPVNRPGTWVESATRRPGVSDYVPDTLRESRYAKEMEDVQRLLFAQGNKGFDTAVSLDRGKLSWALQTFRGVSPDVASKAQQIAETIGGAPMQMVVRNEREWQHWEEANRIFKSLSSVDEEGRPKYPRTLQYLYNPEKMAMAKDDVETLAEIEALVTAHRRPWKALAVSGINETKNVLQNQLVTLKTFFDRAAERVDEQGPFTYDVLKNPALSAPTMVNNAALLLMGDPGREGVSEGLQKLIDSEALAFTPLPRVEGTQQFFRDVVGVVPQIGGALGVGAATGTGPLGAAGFMGAHIYGGTYQDLRKAGVSEDRAATAAFFNAGAQTALNYIGLRAFFNLFSAKGMAQVATRYVEAVGTEFLTEFSQAFPETAANIYGMAELEGLSTQEQVQEFFARIPETMKQGAYEGLVTAFVTAVTGMATVPRMLEQGQALELDMKFWDMYEAAVAKSKLRQRNPREFERQQDEALRDEKTEVPEDIYISPEAINQFFQGNKNQIRDFYSKLEINPETVTEAEATGAEIKIPVSKWASIFSGTEVSLGLRNDIRFDPEGMTANERAQLEEELKRKTEEMQRELEELQETEGVSEEILAMRDVMMTPRNQGGLGMSAADADANLAVFLAGAKQLSKQSGETVSEWLRRVNPVLRAGSEYVAPGQGFDFLNQEGIPEAFRTTNAAQDFGRQASAEQVEALRQRREQRLAEAQRLRQKEDLSDAELQQAMDLAAQAQFDREAMEAASELGYVPSEEMLVAARQYDSVEDFIGPEDTSFEQIATNAGEPNVLIGDHAALIYDESDQQSLGYRIVLSDGTTVANPENARTGGTPYFDNPDTAAADAVAHARKVLRDIWERANAGDQRASEDVAEEQVAFDFSAKDVAEEIERAGGRHGFTEADRATKIRLRDGTELDSILDSGWAYAWQQKGHVRVPQSQVVSAKDVAFAFRFLTDEAVERSYVVAVKEGRVIATSLHTIGTFNAASMYPFEAASFLTSVEADGFYLVHNHPSGRIDPSTNDYVVTKKFRQAMDALGVGFAGHVIVNGEQYAFLSPEDVDSQSHSKVDFSDLSDLDFEDVPVLGPEFIGAKKPTSAPEDTMNSPDRIAHFLRGLPEAAKAVDDKKVLILLSNNQFVVTQAIVARTADFLKDPERVIQELAAKYRGPNVFLAGPAQIDTVSPGQRESNVNVVDVLTYASIDPDKGTLFRSKSSPGGVSEKAAEYNNQNDQGPGTGDVLFQAEEDLPRGSVQFTDSQTIINLYKASDMSTFLHESAHIFMREMQKIIDAGKGDEQFQKDYQTLLDFVDGDLNRAGQEKLARAFEAYLREGRAPSTKLARAFRRFRKWLTAIYKTVKGLQVEITDDIREVFDRILASEQDIAEARAYYEAKKSLADMIPKVKKKTKDRVKKSKEEAEAQDIERRVKQMLAAYLQALGGRKKLREEAIAAIEQEPLYKAIGIALSNGGFIYDQFVERLGPDLADRIEEIHGRIFSGDKKAQTYYKAVLDEGGIDPATMGKEERKAFKEHGLFGLFRKDGRGLDDIAHTLVLGGMLTVPETANPGEYLKEVLIRREKLPSEDLDGIPVEMVAIDAGFESEHELISALLDNPSKRIAVQQKTQELLTEREKQLRRQVQDAETVSGDSAVHHNARLAFLIAEARALAEQLDRAEGRRPQRLEAQVFKDAAEDIILSRPAGLAVRYDLYAKAEQKWARRALEATEAGDLATAHEAKKRQILNHALVMTAVKARDQYRDLQSRYRPKKIKEAIKNVENDFMNQALDLMSQYGLNQSQSIRPPDPASLKPLSDLDNVLAAQTPAWILNRQKPEGFSDYRDLSLQQLFELDDTIKSILSFGRDSLRSIEADQFKTIDEFVEASLEKMDTIKDKTILDESHRGSRLLKMLDGLLASTKMIEYVFERLDGYSMTKGEGFGPLRFMFNEGIRRETLYSALRTEVYEATKPHWDKLYGAKKRITEERGNFFTLDGLPTTEGMKRAGKGFWTAEKLIAILLNSGNTGNKTALENAYGYTEEHLRLISRLFSASEIQAIQDIWDSTDVLFPKMDKVHFNIYNRHVKKVAGEPITLVDRDGTEVDLKGGYYPLMFDQSLSRRAAAIKEDDIMKNRMTTVFRSTKPEDGMTIERKTGHSLPPDLSLGVWFRHIADTARYISHAEYLRDLNRITSHSAWADAVEDKAGRQVYNVIRSWLAFQARPERRALNTWEQVLDGQRKLATVGILGLNLTTGVKQRLSMFSAIKELGWGPIIDAYGKLDNSLTITGLGQNETWQKILRESEYMRVRDGNIDRELTDTLSRMSPLKKRFSIQGKEFTWRDVQDFMFEWIKMNDRAAVGVVWEAAYNKYMNDVPAQDAEDIQTHKDAVLFADSVVRTTQPSALPIDLNELQRKEGLMRMFTSFMTWTFKFGNRFIFNLQAFKDGAISTKEFARHVFYEHLLSPWGAMLLGSLLVTGDPPEWQDWFTEPLGNAVSWVPIIRDIPASMKYYNVPIGGSPAFEGVQRTKTALVSTGKFLQGDAEFSRFLWDLGRVTEFFYGVSPLNLAKDIKRIYDNIVGNE